MVIFALLFIVISSCATTKKARPQFDPAILDKIAAANPYPENMVLTGEAAFKGNKGWVKSKSTVLVRRPDSMRITLLDPAGLAWFVGTVNKQTVAYAAPAKNLYEKIDATEKAMLKIGRIKLNPYDFVRFIHPGMEPAWLANALTTSNKKRLLVKKEGADFKIEFGENMRVLSVTAIRTNVSPVRYVYRYQKDGDYSVEIDRKVRFEFDRVQTGREMSDSLFELPAIP